ncbi:hypothetical protein [Fortiea contorta]|uniref:hypothetical protein n=1 Tax=Fortiea contorta TaxID=1892405 RepID=UPI00034DA1D1|nr:hypothetical protein [Fortiea contorta]
MRTTANSVQTNLPKASPPAYPPPSVPLSVYRELAVELQTVEAKLDVLTAKNQQVVQENQLLRQEITRVIQACLHLQKLVDPQATPTTSSDRPIPNPPPTVKPVTKRPVTTASPRPRPPVDPKVFVNKNHRATASVPVTEMISQMPEPVLITEQEVSYYPPTESKSREISGWWLVITILLIMLTAFGAGYLVVRPLFERQSR